MLLSTKHLFMVKPYKKLTEKYIGPFKMEKVINQIAYKLLLLLTMRIYLVFHITFLEKYFPKSGQNHVGVKAYQLAD